MELYHSFAWGLDGSWLSESRQSAPPALLIEKLVNCCTEKVRSFSAAVVSHLGLNLDV